MQLGGQQDQSKDDWGMSKGSPHLEGVSSEPQIALGIQNIERSVRLVILPKDVVSCEAIRVVSRTFWIG